MGVKLGYVWRSEKFSGIKLLRKGLCWVTFAHSWECTTTSKWHLLNLGWKMASQMMVGLKLKLWIRWLMTSYYVLFRRDWLSGPHSINWTIKCWIVTKFGLSLWREIVTHPRINTGLYWGWVTIHQLRRWRKKNNKAKTIIKKTIDRLLKNVNSKE